jgi:2-iminobutanoate/2-iminopropanoate deaminase
LHDYVRENVKFGFNKYFDATPPDYTLSCGQGPFDPKTGEVVGVTIQEQTAQCLKNIEAILYAAGCSLDQVVSATFILDDPNDFAGMNEEWLKWFPKNPPARQGAKLPVQPKGMKNSNALYGLQPFSLLAIILLPTLLDGFFG